MRRLGRFVLRIPGRLWRWTARNQNLLFVLAALVAMITLAGISGYWLFYRAAYLLAGLIPLCFIWARLHVGGLDLSIERTKDRLQVGQEVETRLRLKSRSMFTKLALEIEDLTDMPGAPARTVITLPAKGRRNWKISTHCRRRGVFSAGPVRVTTGDPFGLFRFSRSFGERQPLIVLPQPEELPYFWAPAAQLPGEGTVHKRTHYVTPNAATVREYYPGDNYNRIHWRTTARLGRLMVKTFEMDPTSNLWVVLDLERVVQAGEGDDGTEEYAVRIATSLAHHFLQKNRMLGLIAHGDESSHGRIVLDPARGAQQYARILEALALARARGHSSLATVLQEEGRRLGRHSTVLIVTPSMSDAWMPALAALLQQGARAAVALVDAASFGATEGTAAPPSETLAAMGVLTYVVRQGADLSLTLGPAGVLSEGLPDRARAGVR